MRIYEIVLFSAAGSWHTRTVVAASESALRQWATVSQLKLAKVRELSWLYWFETYLGAQGGTPAEFSRQLSALLAAELGIIQALAHLADMTASQFEAALYQTLSLSLSAGRSFSEALKEYPDQFPNLYVMMVQLAEQTGTLPAQLSALAEYYEVQDQFEITLKRHCLLPALLALGGGGLAIKFLQTILSRMSDFAAELECTFPWISQLSFDFCEIVNRWALIAAFSILTVAIIAKQWGGPEASGMSLLYRWLPGLRGLTVLADHFLICKAFSLWYSFFSCLSRLPLQVQAGVRDLRVRRHLQRFQLLLLEGEPPSLAMQHCQEFHPVLVHAIQIGEKSRRMPQMLQRAEQYFLEEFQRKVRRWKRGFQMYLWVLGVGGATLLILAVYIPIFELSQQMAIQ